MRLLGEMRGEVPNYGTERGGIQIYRVCGSGGEGGIKKTHQGPWKDLEAPVFLFYKTTAKISFEMEEMEP